MFCKQDPQRRRKRLKFLSAFLKQESAIGQHPALAIIDRIGTYTFRLCRLVGFSRLHVEDLGLSRLFGDSLY